MLTCADIPAPSAQCSPELARLDDRALLRGYLLAVVGRLDERGIPVRAVRTDDSVPGPLAGAIILDEVCAPPHVWTPTGLRWSVDVGWSALLARVGDETLGSVVRYLPSMLSVPSPRSVAHFVVALRADPDTGWASATPCRHKIIDRRVLNMQLAPFVDREPTSGATHSGVDRCS
ncbi:hypothetical protein GCM10023321_47380 [Pseudonocardia eucalypti]|uniref:DUF6292 domain-containing protein n=1 Tax=Pseudonocardia eucalypti TaxID=648755 RepID=A0ABP9QHV6_9PSEU